MSQIDSAAPAPESLLHGPRVALAPRAFTFVLIKFASRCNIQCTYCYWFRDAEVYKKPQC